MWHILGMYAEEEPTHGDPSQRSFQGKAKKLAPEDLGWEEAL